MLKSGKLRALAVGSRARIEPMPDLPTVAESGYKDYEEDVWFGVVAPAKTPKEAVAQLAAWFVEAVQDPEIKIEARRSGALHGRACAARNSPRICASSMPTTAVSSARRASSRLHCTVPGNRFEEEHHGQRVWSAACIATCLFALAGHRCLVAGEDDDQNRRALPGRWQRRHHRAAPRRAHHQEPGTDRRGREPSGRRRLDRLRGGGARGAGRQHAGDQRQLLRHQPACAQGELRSAQKLSADLLSALIATSDRGQQRLVPSHACRFRQDGAVAPEAAGVCNRRARNHAAYRPRAVAARGEHRRHLCALPRRRAGDDIAARRARPRGAGELFRGGGAAERRQGARTRDRRRRSGSSRCPTCRRSTNRVTRTTTSRSGSA